MKVNNRIHKLPMSFTFTVFQQENYILFVHQGELNDANVFGSLEDGINITLQHHSLKMINDYHNAYLNISASKLIEIERFVSDRFLAKGMDPRNICRAIVIDGTSEQTSYYRIFETVNLNHGLRVKLFFDMDQAVQWIKAQ